MREKRSVILVSLSKSSGKEISIFAGDGVKVLARMSNSVVRRNLSVLSKSVLLCDGIER